MGAYESILKNLSRAGGARLLEGRLGAATKGQYIRALAYHGTPAASVSLFRRHLEFLRERFDPVDEKSLASFLNGGNAGKAGNTRETGNVGNAGVRPGLIMSFDDGLRDNYEIAAPLLEEYGFRGWFFVPSNLPGMPADRQAAYCRERTILFGEAEYADSRIGMDWNELRDLASRGHVIGCHTASHLRFSAGLDPEIMMRELAESRERLQAELGTAPASFAWVGGEAASTYAPAGLDAIAAAGFRFAFTTKSSPILPGSDPLVLHRTMIDADTDFDVFRMKIAGVSDFAHRKTRSLMDAGFRNRRAVVGTAVIPEAVAPERQPAADGMEASEACAGTDLRIRLYGNMTVASTEWKELEKLCHPYPFQRLDWIECWQDTVGTAQGYSVCPVMAVDPSGRRALFPLSVSTSSPGMGGKGLRVLNWAGAGISDYGAPLVEPGFSGEAEDFAVFLRTAGEMLHCDAVVLGHIPALLADGGKNPLCGKCLAREHVSAHSLVTPADMNVFLIGRLGSKERYNLRRAEKKLGESVSGTADVTVPVLTIARDTDEGLRIIDMVLEQKRSRYRTTREKDPFAAPGIESFYREAWVRKLPGVEVSAYAAGDTVFAAHWGVREGGTLYVLLPSFDPGEASRHSPGMLLALKLIESCAGTAVKRIDFTIGDEAYKGKLCGDTMELFRFACGTSLRGRAAVALESGLEKLKHNPAILGWVRRVRKSARGFKDTMHGI